MQAVYQIAWSPDSRLLVSGSADSTLKGKYVSVCVHLMTRGILPPQWEILWKNNIITSLRQSFPSLWSAKKNKCKCLSPLVQYCNIDLFSFMLSFKTFNTGPLSLRLPVLLVTRLCWPQCVDWGVAASARIVV